MHANDQLRNARSGGYFAKIQKSRLAMLEYEYALPYDPESRITRNAARLTPASASHRGMGRARVSASRPTTSPSRRTPIHGITGYIDRKAPVRTGSYNTARKATGSADTSSSGC